MLSRMLPCEVAKVRQCSEECFDAGQAEECFGQPQMFDRKRSPSVFDASSHDMEGVARTS
jgi:hypothetical protein